MKTLLAAAALLLAASSAARAADYNDCILEGMKGVQSDVAAAQIVKACQRKYPGIDYDTGKPLDFSGIGSAPNHRAVPAPPPPDANHLYPPTGVQTMWDSCTVKPRTDVPREKVRDYCLCWTNRIQDSTPWSEVVRLDNAVRTRGVSDLDPEEKKIMIKMLMDGEFCYHQIGN